MNKVTTKGIILSETPFQESSKILNILLILLLFPNPSLAA